MEPFSLVVGFGLAIGVGMVANTIVSVFYETGRRLLGPGKRSRLNALGIKNNEKNQEQQKKKHCWVSRISPGTATMLSQP